MSTFTTERLKQLVSYAIKGAGFDKNIELTTYMGIRVEDGELYLNTTDGTNYVSVSDRCVADNMDIVVDADLFAKLISKINSDTVDMEVVDNTLAIKGNGKYTLALIPDENGDTLSFPDKFPDDTTDIGTISASDVLTLNNTMKASLSSVVGSIYSNYYFGDNIVTTDRAMATVYNKKMFDEPYVFGRAFIDLLTLSPNDVTLAKSDNKFVASTEISEFCTISVCTTVTDDVTKFDTGAINKLAGLETPSFCRFKKAQMLELLDRLSLFVSKFDDGAITLNFTDSSIEVSSLKSDGVESVDYTESKDTQNMTIKINIDRFRNQLKAYSSDVVDLYYGSEVCIKLVDGDLTQIIALIK
jgi:hypothetical protein